MGEKGSLEMGSSEEAVKGLANSPVITDYRHDHSHTAVSVTPLPLGLGHSCSLTREYPFLMLDSI